MNVILYSYINEYSLKYHMNILFSQVREDPEVEQHVLNIMKSIKNEKMD